VTPAASPPDPGAPPAAEGSGRRVPDLAGQTTPEQPWPVRLLSAKMAEYVDRMPSVWIEGQLLQLVRRPGTSIAFLTLRDTDVDFSLPVTAHHRVLDAIEAPLVEGARVVLHARPRFWAKRGSLQLEADEIRPVGVGELLARVERLKRALAAEGLFDPARKRPLPFLPRRVGLVCGRASAAERDVVQNARRRWPAVEFTLREVAVQGPTAAAQVGAAVRELDADPEVDVIVITRGGGSLEDLLPFSNETLLRAVAAAGTPVVSAIGHEVDAPLLDLVADVRASTPTDAAKLLVPDVGEQLAGLEAARARLRRVITERLDLEQRGLDGLRSRPVLRTPHAMLDARRQEILTARHRTHQALGGRLDRAGDEIRHLGTQVRALSPAATLERGYAVVQLADGSVVRAPDQAPAGTCVRLRLGGGELTATTD
jgi:exodeoxyribonuclease VII large subunit